MTHLSDDELTLHYYRDPACRGGVSAHLDACAACTGRYREIADALDMIPAREVPARDARYGLEVWQRLRAQLPDRMLVSGALPGGHFGNMAAAAMLLLIVAAALLAWRDSPRSGDAASSRVPASAPVDQAGDSGRRVLLISVADHLERSDRVLTEIMNAAAEGDISTQQDWAEDLLWSGRLYRQSAAESGEHSVAAVLDDLERTFLDIVHSPARATDAELEDVRRRVDSAALLFKVRVLRDELHHQQLDSPGRGEPSIPVSQPS